jgi:hypothetical protein
MEPYYQSRHARQTVGLEGLDLAGKRRREIMASARNITEDSILQFDPTQFHVASQSRPRQFYAIDLHRSTCDCYDFPRIRFCKHIAAIQIHLPHLFPEPTSPTMTPEVTQAPHQPQPQRASQVDESLASLTQDIASLSQQLISEQTDQSALPPAVLDAVRSAKYSLKMAIGSTQGSSALPHKDSIAPNQKTWTETAERMGVKRAPRRKCLPEERGLTERSIGVAKGKRRRVHDDPYAGGERSGKRAKPDAVSAEANVNARALAAATVAAPVFAPVSKANANACVPAPSTFVAAPLPHVSAPQSIT